MKLFLITREDLDPGQQAVQAAHALQEFNIQHAEAARAWHGESNTLAFLAVPNEKALHVLWRKARDRCIPVSGFREPDRQNELTALAIGPEGKGLVRNLPLALQTMEHPDGNGSLERTRRMPRRSHPGDSIRAQEHEGGIIRDSSKSPSLV